MADNITMNQTEIRKQRATQLKNARNYRYAVNEYNRQVEEYMRKAEEAATVAKLQAEQEKRERENQNWFVRTISTIGDVAANIFTGAVKGLEGIYDLGASVVGAVGGIFSKDFQKSVQDHIAYDFTGTNIGQPLQEWTKYSYTNGNKFGEIVENIASGVGQMLPAVAVNLIPGVGQGVSLAMFGAMAAGNSTEEAYQDGASYYRGLGYGIASGAVEMATEKMFGGATKNIIGKGYLDDLTKNVAKTGLARVAKEAAQEGLEEAASEFVNPLLKNIYKDKGFFEDFLTKEHLENIGTSAVVGAGTSVVFGETLGRIRRSAVNIQENINDLEGLAKKEENLWAKNDFSQDEKITSLRKSLYENISKELTSVKPQVRAKLLNQINNYGITGIFNADGTIIDQTATTTQNNAKNKLASYNKEAYTPSLRGKEGSLLYKPTTKVLTEAQVEAKRVFNALNKGVRRSNLVFTNQSLGKDSNGNAINSAYADGTLYINTKANATQAIVEYEMTHSLEGTKAYNKYAEYILKEIADNDTLKQKYGDVEELYEETVNAYTQKLVKEAIEKGQKELSNEMLSKIGDIASHSTITEMVARFTSENIFTNQEQILRLAEKEPSLLKRIANWVKRKGVVLAKGTEEQREVARFLDKAGKLYNRALEASFAGGGFDNQVRDVYNKEKGDSESEQRNSNNGESQKRQEGKDTSRQAGGLEEGSRKTGDGSRQEAQTKIERKFGYKEEVVRRTKIKAVKSRLDYTESENKLYEENKKLGLNTVFYEGSAQPLNIEILEDGGFDGFMDSNTNTVYLRSDSTMTEAILQENNNHEKLHHIFSQVRENYNTLKEAIFSQLTSKSKDSLADLYFEAYKDVYNENLDKIHEEMIVDLVIGRETADFEDVKAVNSAIKEFYAAYNKQYGSSLKQSNTVRNQNAKFTVAHDSKGNPLTPVQNNYFKDSKVRDANGNLLVVYHGTPTSKFYIFDAKKLSNSSRKSQLGQGFYFTDNIDAANEYTKTEDILNNSYKNVKDSTIYSVYLNIKNPLRINDSVKQLSKKALAEIVLKGDSQWFFDNWIPFELEDKDIAGKTYKKEEVSSLSKEQKADLWIEFHYGTRKNFGADRHMLSELVRPYNYNSQDLLLKNMQTVLGVDGIIFEDGGFFNQYIAFDSNQIKETTNINPTVSEDIRYVINKNKDIKDLVVLHNISERKLRDAIKLGGLAVPSLAITTDAIGHENFGDITLVFDKETINPANRQNEVYAADVYSKRFPKMINVLSGEAVKDLREMFKNEAQELGDTTGGIYFEEMSIREMVDSLTREDFVRLKFLRDRGINFEVVKKPFEADEIEVPAYEWIIENNVISELRELHKQGQDDWAYIDKIKPDIAKKLAEGYMNKYNSIVLDSSAPAFRQRMKESWKTEAENVINDIGFGQLDAIIRRADEYQRKKGELVVDEYATREKLRDSVKNLQNELDSYVYDILSKYDKGSYVRKDVDPFDRYGNRKSFNQLYTKVSLANLVEYMKGSVRDSEGFNYGVGNVRSLLAKQFKSLQEIKDNKNKLIPSEEMDKLKEASTQAFEAIASNIHEDMFIANDMLRDIASGSMSEYSIKAVFKDYNRPQPSAETIGEIQEFLNTLKDYPTQYFEAKPQRAVEFEEVKYVIAPYGTDPAIIKFFEEKGVNIKLYGDETSARSNTLKNLPEDIKFVLSRGQLKKEMAKSTKHKVYNKNEAERVINSILSESHTESAIFKSMSGAKKSEAVDKLWIAFNTKDDGFRAGAALDIANYIIENAVAEDLYDYGNEDYQMAAQTVNDFNQYRQKIDLSGIKGEIKYKYDNKSPAIFAKWNTRGNERGLGIGDVVSELRGQGYMIDENIWNDADQFFEIVKMYDKAKSVLDSQKNVYMKDLTSQEEIKQLRQEIAREVLLAYDKYGTRTKFSQTIEKYQKRIAVLTEQLRDTRERNKAINNLFDTVDRVKALEKYKAADIELAPEITNFIKLLSKIKTWRGNLANNVREIMNTYAQDVNGRKLYELIANEADGIANPTAQLIEDIARNRGELTTAELKNLDLILRNFIHNVRNYDRVFFEGRNQSDTELATQAIAETRDAIKVKDEGFLGALSKFTRWLQSPVWRFERLSSYKKDGVMAKVFRELQAGNDKKALFRKQVYQHYEQFFKDNKKLMKTWRNQTVEIDGVKMSKGQMITLYMLSLRKQARTHLFSNENQDFGVVRVASEKYAEKHEFRTALQKGEDFSITPDTIERIANQLTDVDKQYIELTRVFFDEISRNAKSETDMALFGISNVGEENYIPIRVADDQLYKQLGNETMNFNDLFTVYSPSFNKDVKPNAKNKIVVENILDVVNRHATQMSAYYGLAIPVKSFNRIFNKKLEDGSKLRIEVAKVDSSFEKYVGKLLADLQGNIKERSGVDKLVSKLRGWGARASLGLNLKVLATQFVSLPAAAGVGVKYKNLMKGFGMALAKKTDYEALTTYAPMLWERFNEGSTVDVGLLKEGKGVLGKIDMWTDITTAPIGKIDQFVCGAVWNACLEQTKNSPSYDNYSEEHYKAAAKLTEEAIIKTQANYSALYRPEILREQNSFLQLSTMFMSEPLQQFSLLTSAIDKIRVAKLRLKSADPQTRAEAEALLKTAKIEARHAITTVIIDSIILTLIAQAFKWLKGQDDEENVAQSMIQDFADNYIGMIPFARDINSYLRGYDLSNYAESGLSTIGQSIKEMYDIIDTLSSGKSYDQAEINGAFRKILLSLTQTFGIPLRNLETYSKGIIEKFSPEGVYKYEKFFYDGTTSSYIKELTEAIEAGDNELADTILDSFLTEEKIPVKDRELRNTLKELYSQGYNVFPKTVGKKITYNGEQIALTNSQRRRFKDVYQEANTAIKKMVNTNNYKESDSEIQAKAIREIYDYYYDVALEDLLGEDVVSEKDRLFYTAIPIEELALIVKAARTIESEKDKNGNTISGSRKKKVQEFVSKQNLTAAEKYMVMGYLGYKNAVGEGKVKVYIQRLRLTKAEKEALLEYCGYDNNKKTRR